MHDVFMRYVAVGKNHRVNRVFCDEFREFFFRIYGDAFGIEFSRKLRGVCPVFL